MEWQPHRVGRLPLDRHSGETRGQVGHRADAFLLCQGRLNPVRPLLDYEVEKSYHSKIVLEGNMKVRPLPRWMIFVYTALLLTYAAAAARAAFELEYPERLPVMIG